MSSMSSIRTSIDLATEVMHVMAANMSHDLVLPLNENSRCALIDGVKLCGNRFGPYPVLRFTTSFMIMID